MEELKALLEQFFIVKKNNKELYYAIKDHHPKFKKFLVDKLGYDLVVHSEFIKLEKLPGKAESWMGIQDFSTVEEYIFLMLVLTFLEDKNKEEQFLLSHITEYIAVHIYEITEEALDWTEYSKRRALIKVLKFSLQHHLLVRNDGDNIEFTKDGFTEVLYESTGLSRYMIRNFSMDILTCQSYKELEGEVLEGVDMDRGHIRKNRVYRRLLLSPIIYQEGPGDEDYLYIKNFRNILEEDFKRYLQWNLHIHRNGALVIPKEGDRLKNTFPSDLAMSDVVLQINQYMRKQIIDKLYPRSKEDVVTLPWDAFAQIVLQVKEQYGQGWSKELREQSEQRLVSEVVNYMNRFSMIKQTEDMLHLYPLIGKVVGEYPKNYKGGEGDESNKNKREK